MKFIWVMAILASSGGAISGGALYYAAKEPTWLHWSIAGGWIVSTLCSLLFLNHMIRKDTDDSSTN